MHITHIIDTIQIIHITTIFSIVVCFHCRHKCTVEGLGPSIILIVRIMVIMNIILIILLFQVRIDLGLADHVWQNKHAIIAQEVDGFGLGPQFRQALRNGWLKYIKATYAAQP
jgi:hypothetical protein